MYLPVGYFGVIEPVMKIWSLASTRASVSCRLESERERGREGDKERKSEL